MQSSGNKYDDALYVLRKYWKHDDFRSVQKDIIRSVLDKKDTLALMPTGGGKSICFQVPGMVNEGVCVVISPLIALMRDQVEQLKRKGINAVAIYSGMNMREIDIEIDNCVNGKYKFLYLSPERLESKKIIMRLPQIKVNLIAVDEAHCISQWGYDFRPSYLKINNIKELLHGVPIIALTATATKKVCDDIIAKLNLSRSQFFRKSFERKNIAYVVQYEEDKLKRMVKICNNVGGSGIVYVRSRKLTKELSDYLTSQGIVSTFYNAGLTTDERIKRQNAWLHGFVNVMVCTNAFGMGIDKPNVRFVIHYGLTDCIENYFQEAGRAGRDEKKAYAVLLYENSDKIDLQSSVERSFPPIDEIKRVYQALCNYFQVAIGVSPEKSFDFDISDFSRLYKMNPTIVYNAIKLLERDGYVSLSEDVMLSSRLMFSANKQLLYEFQVENKKYDDFIKILLRMYSGLFDNYVMINENQISRNIVITADSVIRNLKELDKLKVVKYQPQKSVPQLNFLNTRVDAKHLEMSKEVYDTRKKIALQRMNDIIHYSESKHICRNILLLNYFEEKNAKTCGHCDVCLENKKKEYSLTETNNIKEAIRESNKTAHLSITEITKQLNNFDTDKVVEVYNWMMDNKEI